MSKVKHNNVKGVELSLSWQPASNGEVPSGAVRAGDGCYVARARHEGEWVPGKLSAGHSSAYIAYGEKEYAYSHYEVLVSSDIGSFASGYEWKNASGDALPKHSIVCGVDGGEPLYVARATIEGEVCVGKAQASHQCAYFPWGGKEHKAENFEVLVIN